VAGGRHGAGARGARGAAHAAGQNVDLLPCDVTDAASVARAIDRLRETWQGIDAVINAAGTNIPARALPGLSPDDFRRVVEVKPDRRVQRHAGVPAADARARACDGGDDRLGRRPHRQRKGGRELRRVEIRSDRTHRVDQCRAARRRYPRVSHLPGDIDTPLLENAPRRPTPPRAPGCCSRTMWPTA
jgi:hypothetical protein